jgi:hypothetical protein
MDIREKIKRDYEERGTRSIYISLKLWREFKTKVAEKKGLDKGYLGQTMEELIKEYVQN